LKQAEEGFAARRGALVVERERVRSQSQPTTIRFNWLRIRSLIVLLHCQMRSTSSHAPNRAAFLLFGEQPSLDNRLRGDAGVIGPRHPQGVVALHAFESGSARLAACC